MKSAFSFTISSLIYNTDDLKAPIKQGLFAQKMAEMEGGIRLNCLCRIEFCDPSINKNLPGGVELEETLLLGDQYFTDGTLHLYIRGSGTYCRIATGFNQNQEVVIHNEYSNAILLKKLSDKQIKEIYSHVWDVPETIAPKKYSFLDLD